jgi:hypothetical protein
MPTHLNYVVIRQQQEELARRAECVRQERDGVAAAPTGRERPVLLSLFARLRPRGAAEAPASTR